MAEKSGNPKGLIFNMQKFSITDGTGIRTLIFMKGCPLRCLWCSNPESMENRIQIMDVKSNCRACGKCQTLCDVHAISTETFEIDRSKCTLCGKCAEQCYANAKKLVGSVMSVDECMAYIKKDAVFYDNSGGGLTVGGGEPLLQAEFVEALFKACGKLFIHRAIETSGYAKWSDVEGVFGQVDQIFYDLKGMDSEKHKKHTGVDNRMILENAANAVQTGKEVIFRIPVIPGYTDDRKNIEETGKFIRKISLGRNTVKVETLPYHNYGSDKYRWLGREYPMGNRPPYSDGDMQEYRDILSAQGLDVIGM